MRISVMICTDLNGTGRSVASVQGQTWQQTEILLAQNRTLRISGDYVLLLPPGATFSSSAALEILARAILEAGRPEIVLFPCQGSQGIVPPPANARAEAPSLAVRADVWMRYSNRNGLLSSAWKRKTQVLRLDRVLVCLPAKESRIIVVNESEEPDEEAALPDSDHPLLQEAQHAAGKQSIPGDAD